MESGANGFEREAPAFFFHEDRDRAVRLEDFLHGHRAGAGRLRRAALKTFCAD